jgi:branched-chain amino acid aminotransferase
VACPEGITRGTVLDLAPAAGLRTSVRDVSLAELYAADEVFCTGTMGEIAGVVSVDGRAIGDGAVGPVTKRVAELYTAHARTHCTPV